MDTPSKGANRYKKIHVFFWIKNQHQGTWNTGRQLIFFFVFLFFYSKKLFFFFFENTNEFCINCSFCRDENKLSLLSNMLIYLVLPIYNLNASALSKIKKTFYCFANQTDQNKLNACASDKNDCIRFYSHHTHLPFH